MRLPGAARLGVPFKIVNSDVGPFRLESGTSLRGGCTPVTRPRVAVVASQG